MLITILHETITGNSLVMLETSLSCMMFGGLFTKANRFLFEKKTGLRNTRKQIVENPITGHQIIRVYNKTIQVRM